MSDARVAWRLSFRVHHPSADLSALAERIGDAFDMDPEAVWRAGDPYPNARPPGQVRGRSYCTVPWPNDRGTVATGMADALAALGPLREELAGLVAWSGSSFDEAIGLAWTDAGALRLELAAARAAEVRSATLAGVSLTLVQAAPAQDTPK